MIEQTAPTPERITCSAPGPFNTRGTPRLFATLDPGGIWIWCKHCKAKHYLERERCIAFWERGESVQCQVAQDERQV